MLWQCTHVFNVFWNIIRSAASFHQFFQILQKLSYTKETLAKCASRVNTWFWLCTLWGRLNTYREISENGWKMQKMKSVQRGILRHFFRVSCPFFSLFAFHARVGIPVKTQRISLVFFRSINKTRNLSDLRKVYSECFAFCGVSRKHSRNTRKMRNTKSVWLVSENMP